MASGSYRMRERCHVLCEVLLNLGYMAIANKTASFCQGLESVIFGVLTPAQALYQNAYIGMSLPSLLPPLPSLTCLIFSRLFYRRGYSGDR